MKIDTQLNTLESTGKRTMKYIRYFGKTYMTDRFVIFMIILIAAAIIAIIVTAIIKDKSLSFSSSSSNSTSSNSTRLLFE